MKQSKQNTLQSETKAGGARTGTLSSVLGRRWKGQPEPQDLGNKIFPEATPPQQTSAYVSWADRGLRTTSSCQRGRKVSN